MPIVRYLVDDVDAALPFYQALGFALAERWGPPFAMLERDGLALWLSGPGTSACRPLDDGTRPGPGGFNRLVIEAPSLDTALAALQAAGAALRSTPVAGPGGRQALVADPSGNLVELFEPAAPR